LPDAACQGNVAARWITAICIALEISHAQDLSRNTFVFHKPDRGRPLCSVDMDHRPEHLGNMNHPRGQFLHPLAVLCLALLLAASKARADWPEFRGPWGDGHVAGPGDTNLVGFPLHWSETNNIKWKTEIPYRGWSTPVVMEDQVWLSTATEDGHDF